ncbi:amidohydrolase [Rhodococcus sp. BP-252]|nr:MULTISPECIES: amidohydrolase [unclassified Rhodococcus (in: high G+C Gram-positive bacteria)]MBY6446602.1 amidohydrolase [Rhodococcus sp. BP-318]MBY6456177.1 amidohydrolase [Rhodococcus sp. BP-277]MBY6466062.1 amidohydrolase [Rhodococcus sp. BP-290]MBY6412843.1 amidohydrolase [Rhodococcus sp. BP-320]MBY6417620.1 amidohydrolase [Rhodococcus sp. BP-321]
MATAYVNCTIHTVDVDRPHATAVLVDGGTFSVVGTDDDIRNAAPPETEFIDLGGLTVIPGLHDAHTHLLFSGLKFNFEARLTPNAGAKQIAHDLEHCQCASLVDATEQQWLVGGEFLPAAFEDGELDRRFLDEVFPDQPVFLYDYTIHHALVNSKALEIAGLDDSTPDPVGGKFIRRPGTTELTGELVEQATWPVTNAMPKYRPEIDRAALRWAIDTCHRFGITSVQEASASPRALAAMKTLEDEDQLNLHIAAHLVWREESFGQATAAELDESIANRDAFASKHLDTRFVKIWLDGAPLPPHMTQADLDAHGNVDESNIVVEAQELADVIGRFDAAGLSVKIHCAGEGSVRAALNAFESVRARNGEDGPLHEVAHCTFIHDDDYARFGRNNIVAEMSPAIWHIEEFGLQEGYQFRKVLESGTTMTIGSDWIITPDPNLFPALQGMLDKGESSVDLETAIRLLTIEGARVVGRAETRGSITPGKSADMIVLDRPIFDIPITEVGDTRVLRTVFEGTTVYDSMG